MSGNRLFVDTNIVLYLLGGDETVAELLSNKGLYLSVITEMELMSYPVISETIYEQINAFIQDCIVVNINEQVKQETIRLRKKYKLKLPDSIIMASSSYLEIPFITADKGFKKVASEIDVMFYEK